MNTLRNIGYIVFFVIFTFVVNNVNSFWGGDQKSYAYKKASKSPPVLNIYTWVEYLDPEIVSDFEKEFRIKVNVDVYDDEDVMYSLVQSQPGQYDVIFPTDYMVDLMMKSGLLLQLNLNRIPNMKNIKNRFKTLINKKWDGYCATIDWGAVGVAYNTKYIKDVVESWGIFWNEKYKGRMALVNNGYEVMSVGQKLLGYPLNPTNPGDFDKPLKILKELRPLLQDEGFMPYNKIKEKLISEELWIGQCYNADAATVNEKNNAVKFFIPKEGTGYWVETLAIPIGSKNKQLAEEFINFMLRPEISARHTNYSHYENCNKKAWVFVDKKILRNPYIYLDTIVIDKMEVFEVLNPDVQRKFNECWAELQTD